MTDSFKNRIVEEIEINSTDSIYKRMQVFKMNNSKLLYPYHNFDELKLYKYNGFDAPIEFLKNIDSLNSYKLFEFINTPTNFGLSECGTTVPEFEIHFYYKKHCIGKVILSCDKKYIEWLPENELIYFGEIMQTKRNKLIEILFPL
jgi:hypothetical protein